MANYLLYRLGQFIALRTPLSISYKIAVFVSDLRYIFAYRDRRETKKNLRAIFPEKSEHEIRKIRIRMFRNFAKYLVDFFRFEKLDKEYVKRNIKIENIHYFAEALAEGKGAIALSAHLGNWELGGAVIALSGYDFWIVALPHKNKKVDNFFNAKRESKGVNVIPLGKAVRKTLTLLKENKLVALVGDRDFKETGKVVEFFGKPTILPIGPAAFALKTGALIVPGFMLRNKDDSFTLTIEKPIKPSLALENNDNGLLELINQYKIILEGYIRRFPEQWYMFRRFWIE